MRKRDDILKFLLLALVIFISISISLFFIRRFLGTMLTEDIERIIMGFGSFFIFFIFFRKVGTYIKNMDIPRSKQISQQVKILGYVISLLIFLSFFKELTMAVLTIGTISGLILGITLQPVLGNFFAGVLITFTRYIDVGRKIRILSSSIPFGSSTFPAYKFLSVEEVDIGYKGEIVEIDWFFSTIKTEEGKIIKIPNLVLLNSAVLDYTELDKFIYSIRVEFPLKMKKGWNLERLEKEINKILKRYNVISGPYFNEQSDKNYVYIRTKIESKIKDWEREKSEVLKKLLRLKEKIEEK